MGLEGTKSKLKSKIMGKDTLKCYFNFPCISIGIMFWDMFITRISNCLDREEEIYFKILRGEKIIPQRLSIKIKGVLYY